ncbi:MAG: hypothetical protein AAFV93_23810 [Chloroflexota bacterium]
MGYFSQDDIQAVCGVNATAKTSVKAKFQALQQYIYEQLAANDIELSLIKSGQQAIGEESISRHVTEDTDVLAVQYLRARGKAVTVEKLMGREEVASVNTIITRLHPVIEVRLAESGLCVELLLAPSAWWDQQNFKGKLAIPRHRHAFYTLLMDLDPEYTMGFWQGIHLSEMRIAGKYFQHPRILDDWLSTFEPNTDWLRIGIWLDIDAEELSSEHIKETLVNHIFALYPLYQYILWTSDNNYREFND